MHSLNGIRNLFTVMWYISLAVISFACIKNLRIAISGAGGVDKCQVLLVRLCVPFIPSTNLCFYVEFVVAERILYIHSIGFCLLAAKGIFLIHRNCSALMKKVTCLCYSLQII